jgi:hypothetical protein
MALNNFITKEFKESQCFKDFNSKMDIDSSCYDSRDCFYFTGDADKVSSELFEFDSKINDLIQENSLDSECKTFLSLADQAIWEQWGSIWNSREYIGTLDEMQSRERNNLKKLRDEMTKLQFKLLLPTGSSNCKSAIFGAISRIRDSIFLSQLLEKPFFSPFKYVFPVEQENLNTQQDIAIGFFGRLKRNANQECLYFLETAGALLAKQSEYEALKN